MSSHVVMTGRIVIAGGGTGFLGRNLTRHLTEAGRDVVVLTRRPPTSHDRWRYVAWDGRTLGDWVAELEGADALVNLAGRTVDCIKTPDHCDEILRSRVESTEVLGRALHEVGTCPRVWVQMSTAHCYGDPPSELIDENSPFGHGLAPDVATAWENECARTAPAGLRTVILRASFVLGRHGGALRRLTRLARFGLGGKVGHGKQGISWIHEHDMNRLFSWAIENESVSGAYIATAPNPVSNAEFMRALRRALRVPIGLPAMEWMVRIGAPMFLRTDPELALHGRYCVSRRLHEEGFEFRFDDLASALRDLCGSGDAITL